MLKLDISLSSKVPMYEQITTQMIELIGQGDLQIGQPIPSMRALAASLGVSIITIKKAYGNLEEQGYIYSRVGRGSYIAEQIINEEEHTEKKHLAVHHFQLAIQYGKEVGMTYEESTVLVESLWEK